VNRKRQQTFLHLVFI